MAYREDFRRRTIEYIEALARCLLPEMEKYFESEMGQREFEEWKKQQTSKDENNEK